MDQQLTAKMDEMMPQLNESVCHGLACEHILDVERYVDKVFQCASAGFPADLKYIGYKRCTPKEQFEELTKFRNDRFVFELARTDTFMVKYYFSWQGKQLPPKKINLPYVNDGGLMFIRGVQHAISPVLADPLFSISPNSIFMPLTRAKLTFERSHWQYYADNKRSGAYVVWSHVHNNSAGSKNTKDKPSVPAAPTMVSYLLCKYGFTDTAKQFGISQYAIGTEKEINTVDYPEKDWVICKTATNLRRGTRMKVWIKEKIARDGVQSVEPTRIHLAIPRKEYELPHVPSFIAGFFYVADHFPDRVQPEYVDNVHLWKIIMGHINYPAHIGEGKMVERIQSHLDSLDEYVDSLVQESLLDEGIRCDDIYQLFIVINNMLSSQVVELHDSIASMYGKKLFILRYLMSNLVRSIFELLFRLLRNKKELTEQEVAKIVNDAISTDAISQIVKQHGEVSIIPYPGDQKTFKVTANLVPQSAANGNARGKSTVLDASSHLHSSIAEVGSILNLPKTEPTGRRRINPFIVTTESGRVMRDESKREILDTFQKRIAR